MERVAKRHGGLVYSKADPIGKGPHAGWTRGERTTQSGKEDPMGHVGQAERWSMEKAPTYIAGLDEVLEGGLPRGRTTVLRGQAGSGKTLLSLEFLLRGALAGEPGIFVGFEEPVAQLRQDAASLGWDLAALEGENRLFLLEAGIKAETVLSGDFSLKGLLAAIAGKGREMGARRVVIDALEVALRLLDEPQKVRAEMHMLNDWLREQGLTVIMTVRPAQGAEAGFMEGFFESMGDCVISLSSRVEDYVTTRRLRVVKYRGSGFGGNEYPYVITDRGLFLAPISTVGLRHKELGEKMPTGVERLDRMLDGGYRRASCVLVAGEPGTGKTTLICAFVRRACDRGERVLYIGFEESQDALVGNMMSCGMDLGPQAEAGRLEFLCQFPEAMGVDEHYLKAMKRIEAMGPQHVVVDAISACERMGGKQAAFDYLMRLLNACKERGITIFLVNQTAGRGDQLEISGNGISSMVDTAILLTYQEEPGETNRLIQVLKSRGSSHSNQKREFRITDQGLAIIDAYLGGGRVLTGTARQVQEEADRAEAERLAFEIEAKELELKRLRQLERLAARGVAQRATVRGDEGSG